jgi:hypothetical protein
MSSLEERWKYDHSTEKFKLSGMFKNEAMVDKFNGENYIGWIEEYQPNYVDFYLDGADFYTQQYEFEDVIRTYAYMFKNVPKDDLYERLKFDDLEKIIEFITDDHIGIDDDSIDSKQIIADFFYNAPQSYLYRFFQMKQRSGRELKVINKKLEQSNNSLKEKDKELEDMMSMFAHKFRSPLDAIIYNTHHENNPKLYIEAAQTMRGLLDIFSIISTDEKILKGKIKTDNQGGSRLPRVLSKTLNMILLHLLSTSGTDKIQQHYIAYAKAHGKIDSSVTPKIWNEDYFELERTIQTEWESSFSELLSKSGSLQECLDWIERHFFKLELIGFERDDIQFKEYSVTESFLTILFNEILVNAFKYYSSETNQSVVLELSECDENQVIICHNPSVKRERTTIKGSGKGHVFLSALASKIGSKFSKPKPQDDFVVEFAIPSELLISNQGGKK